MAERMEAWEVVDGLWIWTVPVLGAVCAYLEAQDAVLLVDPQVPPEDPDRERFFRALDGDVARHGRPVTIALTTPAEPRSTDELAARYPGSRVVGPPGCGGTALASGDLAAVGVLAVASGAPGELAYRIATHDALVVARAGVMQDDVAAHRIVTEVPSAG